MIPNQKKDPTNNNGKSYIRKLLDSNYQEVKRSFVLANDDTDDNGIKADSHKKY